MDEKQISGPKPGRPKVTDRPGFNRSFQAIFERLERHEISRRQATRLLQIGYASLKRLLDGGYRGD